MNLREQEYVLAIAKYQTLKSAAEGLGIAFHFLGYIQYFSYPKPISFFPVGDPKALIDYYIVRRKDAYLAPQISDFIQILGKQMARHAPLVLPQGERGV